MLLDRETPHHRRGGEQRGKQLTPQPQTMQIGTKPFQKDGRQRAKRAMMKQCARPCAEIRAAEVLCDS